jgi:hypothetical protein
MIIKDLVVERSEVGKCPPMILHQASALTGFPLPPKVEEPLAKARAAEAQANELVLTTKEIAKLEWTNPVAEQDTDDSEIRASRYDFNGNESSEQQETYLPELYHHGDEPGRPGYTLDELLHLSQSGFASQKALAVKSLGAISENQAKKGPKTRRQFHRLLIGEYKMHVRLAVACSDTSINVRSAACISLLQLIEGLDRACGCVIEDLSSIPEFFRAFDRESESSVKVFLYISNVIGKQPDSELDEFVETCFEAATELGISNPEEYICGLTTASIGLRNFLSEQTPPAEFIATLCDRVACLGDEPLLKEDIDLFECIFEKLNPSIPFFAPDQVDEYSWSSRCNLVISAVMEFGGHEHMGVFLIKFCWLFTSSLFPIECRAAVWGNTELLANMHRLLCVHNVKLGLLGNHRKLDFLCNDVTEIKRDSSLILRSIGHGCSKFLEENAGENSEISQGARSLKDRLAKV